MTKRERVMAALRGEAVDRVPLSFWMHHFVAENGVETFVAESLRLAREFGWDYLKPQSRAQCFAEAWGSVSAVHRARDAVHAHARAVRRRRRAAPPAAGRAGDGRARRSARGPETDPGRRRATTPIIWTVFSPHDGGALSLARRRRAGARHRAAGAGGARSRAGCHRLHAGGYARLALAAGADGLFYATNVARQGLLSPTECRRFQRPYDLRVLAAPRRPRSTCCTSVAPASTSTSSPTIRRRPSRGRWPRAIPRSPRVAVVAGAR